MSERKELKAAIEHILTVAQRMSNVLYNYGQHPRRLDEDDARMFMAASREWDAACARYREVRKPTPSAKEQGR